MFVQQQRKHGEMAFLTSRSASKHVLFTLGVDSTARDAGEGNGSDLVLQATPFAMSCETTVAVHVRSLHKSSVAKPRKRQANAVSFATKVLFSLFGGSEVIVRLMSGRMGKLCNM